MTFGGLFSGIGGIDLGLQRAGMVPRWQVEIDPWCRRVLAKHWPDVKRYSDIRGVELFDQETWRKVEQLEPVDLLAGGFPCQDISTAGKGIGIVGSRSGLWSEFARLVGELRPRFVLAENVPALRSRGLTLVLQDLMAFGYDAEWHCIPASALGAPHERDRIWIVAYPAGMFREAIIWGEPERAIRRDDADVAGHGCGGGRPGRLDRGYSWQPEQTLPDADTHGAGLEIRVGEPGDNGAQQPPTERGDSQSTNAHSEPLVGAAIARGECSAWTSEPSVVRMVHGIPNRVDRLKGLGNSVVPQVVEWIGRRIMEASAEYVPVCPSCCRSVIQKGLAVAGEICQGCKFMEAYK